MMALSRKATLKLGDKLYESLCTRRNTCSLAGIANSDDWDEYRAALVSHDFMILNGKLCWTALAIKPKLRNITDTGDTHGTE